MYRSNYDLSDDPIFTHPLGIFADRELPIPMQVVDGEAARLLADWEAGKNGYTTGLTDVDEVYHMFPGELSIIGGMSSAGKTVLGMQFMRAMASQIDRREECVVVFSAEMSGAMLELRMASAAAGVNLHHVRLGKFHGEEKRAAFAAIREQTEIIRTLPLWFDDSKSPTTLSMMNKLKELSETIKVKGMLFDFMELAGDENENEERRVAGIGKALKGIAEKLEIPVLALSQLNEKANDRANKMPSINDLRYSRTLTHIADNIIFPVRPSYYIERGQAVSGFPDEDMAIDEMNMAQGKPQRLAYILIGKQRNGEVRLVKTLFDKTLTRFQNLEIRRTPL